MSVRIAKRLLEETFEAFRRCGEGRRECLVLWISAWHDPDRIIRIIHPRHAAHAGGFEVEGAFLTELWLELERTGCGIRIQTHTHRGRSFHSTTDDQFPIVHVPGFLSLVFPSFGLGRAGLRGAYLAQIGHDGSWHEVALEKGLEVE